MRILIFLLSIILISNICFAEDYNRNKHFGNGWIDVDNDGQDTRQEVLERDSLIPVGYDSNGNINYGLWYCSYTGTITANPSDFDIDHFVPIFEAYYSGANLWNQERRIEYANHLKDPLHLVAVTLGSNRQKGAKSIADWLPLLNEVYYIVNWIEIKEKWNLCFDKEEIEVIIDKLGKYHVPDNVCK